jgi:predicted GTPase
MRGVEKSKKEAQEEIEKRKREQAAREDVGNPTREDFLRAQRIIEYDPNLFHFAIIGKSGCGKSSLINAFRNLRNNDAGASEAGTTETTLDIGRYPAGCWDGASPKQDGMV